MVTKKVSINIVLSDYSSPELIINQRFIGVSDLDNSSVNELRNRAPVDTDSSCIFDQCVIPNPTMIYKFSIFLVTYLTFEIAMGEHHAFKYSAATFPIEVAKKDHFVMFYAPWCVHSRNLGNIWKQLARMFNGIDEGRVLIAKVDCDTDNTVCVDNYISGYPSLMFFKAGRSRGTEYTGSRDLVALRTFVNQQIGAVDDELEMYRSADGRFTTWVYRRL